MHLLSLSLFPRISFESVNLKYIYVKDPTLSLILSGGLKKFEQKKEKFGII